MHVPFLYHGSDCVTIRLDGPYQAIMTNQLCSRDYHFICEHFPACAENTFGANCLEKCSETCHGTNNTCDNFTGFCNFGCVDGYGGERCEHRIR
ncbi:hypothetical protein RRG08_063116 [Elysia crispata]|uniref:Uncharacterized protein n=1 Tax=Elysia crispata TaxID=231223 RepID=A0AAE1CN63_9GAST|nr:hypothetical protein RRG08_063116 [Elysia crispata]